MMVTADSQQRIRICRERYESAPQSRAFAPLADALRQAGELEAAQTLLEAGLARHPEFPAAQVILGHTLLDAGRTGEAGRVLQRVLAHDPQNVVALRLLTEDARSRHAWHEAVPLLERLCALESHDERWAQALAEAREYGNQPDPGAAPETSFATMTLVEIYLAQGYRAKAMMALRQMHETAPDRQDIKDKIAEIGILEQAATTGKPVVQVGGEGGLVSAGAGAAGRRELLAAKRALEKKNFETWIKRLRSDESPPP
jgi:cytochrome c-type biogenesis protein CcmH/NrfG